MIEFSSNKIVNHVTISWEKAFEIVLLRVNLRIIIVRYLVNKLKDERE